MAERRCYSAGAEAYEHSEKACSQLRSMHLQKQERCGASGATLRALLILCAFLGASCRIDARGASTTHSQNFLQGFHSGFAIADFDGDRKPDLATVEFENGSSSRTAHYSIRFQLTLGTEQVFGVTAPPGGLQIVARDVNGDSALDVLVSTAWAHEEVAVLLDDGHGNFTLADPGAYPEAKLENAQNWNSGTIPLCDSAALLRTEYPTGDFDATSRFAGARSEAGRVFLQDSPGSTRFSLLPAFGRAPPAVFQS